MNGNSTNHAARLRPGTAAAALLLSGSLIAGCSGSHSLPPLHRDQPATIQGCPPIVYSVGRAPQCMGGGGGDPYLGTSQGYRVYGATTSYLHYRSSAVDGTGTTAGAGTGSIVSDPSDGTEHIAVTDNQNNISYDVTSINGHFIGEGTTALSNGVTITKNSAIGTAVADFTDGTGTAWHAAGVVDADGVNVDVTLTNSNGFSNVGKYPINLWAPSFRAAMATARAPQSARHVMAPSAAKVAIAAATVAGVMGVVSGVCFGMGLVPAGAVAGALAIGATVVAGVAQGADQDEKDKAQKKC